MSIASKISMDHMPAYFIGRFVSNRDTWMFEARKFARKGDKALARHCVGFARDYNNQMLRELRRLRAMGGV